MQNFHSWNWFHLENIDESETLLIMVTKSLHIKIQTTTVQKFDFYNFAILQFNTNSDM